MFFYSIFFERVSFSLREAGECDTSTVFARSEATKQSRAISIKTKYVNMYLYMDYIKNKDKHLLHIISLPIIFSVLIPAVVLDIWVEIYHRICFALYGLEYVKRGDYIKIDRQKLNYLRWYQKLGCAYCGYTNGLVGYWTSITSKTEKYWCGIVHKKSENFHEPKHHKDFARYDDKKDFVDKYVK